ncbi:MAG: hypothetical protein ABSH16_03870 [Sedimentisphaerales bacterium]
MKIIKKRNRLKKSKTEFFQEAARRYMEKFKVTEFDPDDVAKWLVDTEQYVEVSRNVVKRCKHELVKALRAEHVTDNQGRDVRANLGARYKNEQGYLWSRWSPIYLSKPQHARLALQQWRRSIRGEVLLHDRTTRSYNDNNVHGAQLELFDYDMNKDRDEANMPEQYPDEKPVIKTGNQEV